MTEIRKHRFSSTIGRMPLNVALRLYLVEGWNFREIGDVAGVTRQAVHLRISSIPESLRREMALSADEKLVQEAVNRRPRTVYASDRVRDAVVYLFVSGARIREIADLLGVSADLVSRVLRRSGYHTRRSTFRPLPEIEEKTRRAWEKWKSGASLEEVASFMGLGTTTGVREIFRWYGYES